MLDFFMTNIINSLKNSWVIVVIVIASVLYINNKNRVVPMSGGGVAYNLTSADRSVGMALPFSSKMMVSNSVAPSESANRLVIQDTSLSLQVDNVEEKIAMIQNKTADLGGFLVNSNLSKPNGVGSGIISVRIPENKRMEAMEIFKNMAVKVVSENVLGTDVTDQYSDLQAKLDVLNKTKMKFEEILDKAFNVSDLMNVQQQLISLQQQIDNIKGQQKYYEQSAKLSKITIYLSTDDLALPYAPTNEWRPTVIFKEAVRSLVGTFRNIGNLLIWGVVYIPIIIPTIGVIWFWKKRQSKV